MNYRDKHRELVNRLLFIFAPNNDREFRRELAKQLHDPQTLSWASFVREAKLSKHKKK